MYVPTYAYTFTRVYYCTTTPYLQIMLESTTTTPYLQIMLEFAASDNDSLLTYSVVGWSDFCNCFRTPSQKFNFFRLLFNMAHGLRKFVHFTPKSATTNVETRF